MSVACCGWRGSVGMQTSELTHTLLDSWLDERAAISGRRRTRTRTHHFPIPLQPTTSTASVTMGSETKSLSQLVRRPVQALDVRHSLERVRRPRMPPVVSGYVHCWLPVHDKLESKCALLREGLLKFPDVAWPSAQRAAHRSIAIDV